MSSSFVHIRTIEGANLHLSVYWPDEPPRNLEEEPICSFSLLCNYQHFSNLLYAASCNQQLVHEDLQQTLREVLRAQDRKYNYSFNAEQDLGTFVVQMPLDTTGKSFVTMFKAELYESHHGVNNFLQELEGIITRKTTLIREKQAQVDKIKAAKELVSVAMQEVIEIEQNTGLLSANELLPIFNQAKLTRKL